VVVVSPDDVDVAMELVQVPASGMFDVAAGKISKMPNLVAWLNTLVMVLNEGFVMLFDGGERASVMPEDVLVPVMRVCG
jgi:hypothetical protein